MNRKWRWLIPVSLMAIIPVASLLVTNVSARTKRPTRSLQILDNVSPLARTPIYNAGNFTFGSTQQLLPGALAETLGFQDVEPEIKIDIFGNIYVTAIQGLSACVDF